MLPPISTRCFTSDDPEHLLHSLSSPYKSALHAVQAWSRHEFNFHSAISSYSCCGTTTILSSFQPSSKTSSTLYKLHFIYLIAQQTLTSHNELRQPPTSNGRRQYQRPHPRSTKRRWFSPLASSQQQALVYECVYCPRWKSRSISAILSCLPKGISFEIDIVGLWMISSCWGTRNVGLERTSASSRVAPLIGL